MAIDMDIIIQAHQALPPTKPILFLEAHDVKLRKNWEFSKQSAEVQRLFRQYFYYGGFPELTSVIDKRAWITGIFQKIFFSDVIVRNGGRNEDALRMTIRKLADSIKTTFHRQWSAQSFFGRS